MATAAHVRPRRSIVRPAPPDLRIPPVRKEPDSLLSLHLFGAPSVLHGDDAESSHLGRSPKLLALLSYLVMAPAGAGRRRDALTALLWPERDHEHARHALRQLLSRVRQTVGPRCLVCNGDDVVRLEAGRIWCDVIAFLDALEADRPEDALACYRGPFLDAFHLGDAADFGLWAAEVRQTLLGRAVAAAEQLADRAREGQDAAAEVRWLERALELDPYSEGRSGQLVRLLLATGECGAAARERERLRCRLEEDLGIDLQSDPLSIIAREREAGPPVRNGGPPRRGADDHVRRGYHHLGRWSSDGMERAVGHFSRAVRVDRSSASPHAGLSLAYAVLGQFGHLPPDLAFRRVEEEARLALDLDEGEADAHLGLGLRAHLYDRDVGAACGHLSRARTAAPDHPLPHCALGLLHASLGQHDEARESMRRARLLDPLPLPVTTGETWVYIAAGDVDGAERLAWNTLELHPDAPHALWQLGIVREMQGHPVDAVSQFRRALMRSPGEQLILASLGHALAMAGDEAESRRILRRLQEAREGGHHVPSLACATVHAGRGEVEAARRWLQRAVAEHDGLIAFLGCWPFLRSLHDEPWFPTLQADLFVGRIPTRPA